MVDGDALPRPFGPAVMQARMRCTADDFVVDEQLGFAPEGAGEHLFLRVRKRGANTAFVAQQLQQWAGIDERGVGYAGMKDRHAVTTQTFSLYLPGRQPPAEWPRHADFEVLEATRHGRKLPRGALAGNRFDLTLREVGGERDAIDDRLGELARHGFANYFGEQRFGHAGGNVAAAERMFKGQRVKREQRGILLSAARSLLFNRVLAARVANDTWRSGIDGDVWMLNGSHSVFGPQALDDELRQRALEGDIHPTGCMWGKGALRTDGDARALEEQSLEGLESIKQGLVAAGLRQERRALRCPVTALSTQWQEPGVLKLSFFLPAGAYATALLFAIGDVEDVFRPQ